MYGDVSRYKDYLYNLIHTFMYLYLMCSLIKLMQRPGSFCISKEKTLSFHFLFSHKRHLDAYYVYCAQNKSVCKYQMANAFQCTFSRKLKPVSLYPAGVLENQKLLSKSKFSVFNIDIQKCA